MRPSSPLVVFAMLGCLGARAAPLVHGPTGVKLQADWGLGRPEVRSEALGLQPREVLRCDLSTELDEALLQLAAQGLVNRSGPLMWLDNAPVAVGMAGKRMWKKRRPPCNRADRD